MGGLKQKVWYPLSHISHTSILESFPGLLKGTDTMWDPPSLISCPNLACGYTLTCTLGTLCIQGTANQHACGQSEQCPDRLHDSDAHSWYRRTSHTAPLAPHILHSEPLLQEEGRVQVSYGVMQSQHGHWSRRCRHQSVCIQAHRGRALYSQSSHFTGTE